ncbi:MAG: Glycine--tRNA ligase [Chloroflexota bacterium]|jgi:glycyl-tRNA synthetase|nr:MAG: Glycine--tRNA ligase [Chloroflexota bacterium]
MTRYLPYGDMEKLLSLSKRRGFVFQSSEVYGGLSSTWDYGPLGVELKRNVKEAWWKSVVVSREDVVGLDAAILMQRQVWEASGHLENFSDPLVECKNCHIRLREDQMQTEICPMEPSKNPEECSGELTDPMNFNLMFKTFQGPVEETASEIFLRPETAQGIFVNFNNVLNSSRKKLPFGIAQIGKSFRNEITPGNFTFRTREFEQMEIEFFVTPGDDDEWLQSWLKERYDWYLKYGIREDNLRIRKHDDSELAHYAKETYDIEYRFPWGWGELEGIANRTDFDLKQHAQTSGTDISYFDEATKSRFVPYVIEPSGGVDRATLAFWLDAYDEEPDGDSSRTVLKFHRLLAPVTVAILPLSKNEKLAPLTKGILDRLKFKFKCQYDDSQSIGRRYRRQDEIGTPFCVTIDFDSLEDDKVTIRERDSMHQSRIPISDLVSVLEDKLEHNW